MNIPPAFKKITPLFSSQKTFSAVAILLSLLYAVIGSVISVVRFWQYDVFYYDFGIFDRAIWQVAHFQVPIMEHFIHGGKVIFADHFSPSIFLFSPLYWITAQSEIILIAQAVCVAASAYVLYLIGIEVTKKPYMSLTIMVCYMLFIGLQNAVITDFHEVTVATLPLMLTYYCFLKKRFWLCILFFLITLGFKESNFLLGFAVGISLFFIDRKAWKLALGMSLFSLLYGVIVIKGVIPYFAQGSYGYDMGLTLNPLRYITSLGDNEMKRYTLRYTFASFGFLPLFSPAFYVVMLEDILSRFYPPFLTLSWGLGLHYSALTAVIMGISSLYGIKLIGHYIKNQAFLIILCVLLLLHALFLYRVTLRGPFALFYNPAFYHHTKDFSFLDTLVKQVPRNASVMTQNNLAVRFTHQNVSLLRSKCKTCIEEYYVTVQPEYIVMDLRDGQNPNDFYGVDDMQPILLALQKDPNYKLFYSQDKQYIFKKQ